MENEQLASGRVYNYDRLSFDDVSVLENTHVRRVTPGQSTSHAMDDHQQQLLTETGRDSDIREHKAPQRKQKLSVTNRILMMGWWWEFASALLSVVCTSLIVAILFSVDNKPIEDWKLPIQPNSLVAVFSTIAKSAVLFPLAECIGQLKWHHFDDLSAKSLEQMQAFDAATRGPWGAATFTWRTRGTAMLASMGTIITVLLLALEPFTQQILAFSSRNVLLHNETASVLATNTWFQPNLDLNRGNGGAGDYEKVLYPLTMGMLGTIIKRMPLEPVSSFCPTSRCKFQDFTTLGVCSSCIAEVIDKDYFDECIITANNGNLTYDSLSDFQNDVQIRMNTPTKDNYLWSAFVQCKKYYDFNSRTPPARIPLFLSLKISWHNDFEYPPEVSLSGNNGTENSEKVSDIWTQSWDGRGQAVGLGIGNVRYLQTYGASGKAMSSPTEIMWFNAFNSTTELGLYSKTEELGVINGTVSFCQLEFCAHTHKGAEIKNGQWRTSRTEETPLKQIGTEELPHAPQANPDRIQKNLTFSAPGVADNFRIGVTSFNSLKTTILQVFENDKFQDGMHMLPFNQSINGDWIEFSRRIASVVSSVLSSSGNLDAKNITGEAYGQKVFIEVRWLWFSGPIAMVLFSVVFLVLTIMKSSKKEYLFKTSILAILFHGLENWELHSIKVEIDGRKTNKALSKLAKGMKVRLSENDEGILKLKKE